MRRILIGVLLAATAGVTVAIPTTTVAAVPHHVGPTKAAWFDATRPTATTPAAPMPGVGKDDLLVEGITIETSQLPLSLPALPVIKKVTAFTALSFRLPKGATPATLTLMLTGLTTAPIDAKLPTGVSPVACPTTSGFHAGGQQSMSAAPTYDCSKRTVVGQLRHDGKAVTFPGIGRLQQGRRLSFVVLPGSLGLDRLIFAKPTAKTLSLLSFGGTPPPIPAESPTPVAVPSSHAGNTGTPTGPTSGSDVPIPPVTEVTTPPVQPTPPQVAAANPSPLPTLTAAASGPDVHRQRTAALALLVALVVATAWLVFTEAGNRAITALRVIRALNNGTPLPAITATEWGVGRFRAPRHGPPPTL